MIIRLLKRLVKKMLLMDRGIIFDLQSDVWVKETENNVKNNPVNIFASTVSIKKIGGGSKLYKCSCFGEITIGSYTSIFGPGTVLSSVLSAIKIGNFCSIGQNVSIQDSNHRIDKVSSYFMARNLFGMSVSNDVSTKGDVVIEDDVWIGSNSVILSGVLLGRGSIVGAGSVVTKNVPPYSVVAGVPARVIKRRFDDEIISYLETLKWWEWPGEKIKKNKELFLVNLDNMSVAELKDYFRKGAN